MPLGLPRTTTHWPLPHLTKLPISREIPKKKSSGKIHMLSYLLTIKALITTTADEPFNFCLFYTPPLYSGGVLWFRVGHLCVRPSVHPSVRLSVFCFRMITWVNINWFSPNLVCALILWRIGLGLLMGNFRHNLTVICSRHAHIFISGW